MSDRMETLTKFLGDICEHQRRIYKAGDSLGLMIALDWCLQFGQIPPAWVRDAIHHAAMQVDRFEKNSWDQVFGPPHRGRRPTAGKFEHDYRLEIWKRVLQLRAKRPRPRDIWRQVASELPVRMSGDTVRKVFQRINRSIQNAGRSPMSGMRNELPSSKEGNSRRRR